MKESFEIIMPESKTFELPFSYGSIHTCYSRACYGSDMVKIIPTSKRILCKLIDVIYDDETINKLANFYACSVKSYVARVLNNELPLKFHDAQFVFDPTMPEDEMEFRPTRIGKDIIILKITSGI